MFKVPVFKLGLVRCEVHALRLLCLGTVGWESVDSSRWEEGSHSHRVSERLRDGDQARHNAQAAMGQPPYQ